MCRVNLSARRSGHPSHPSCGYHCPRRAKPVTAAHATWYSFSHVLGPDVCFLRLCQDAAHPSALIKLLDLVLSLDEKPDVELFNQILQSLATGSPALVWDVQQKVPRIVPACLLAGHKKTDQRRAGCPRPSRVLC